MKKWSVDLPHITDKQKELLLYIYKFRFLDRKQIQSLMKHKDYKRINIWLGDLVTKGYLFRIYERKIPLNIKPAIYYVAPTGVRLFKYEGNFEIAHKLYREKYRSERFRNHCLLIASLYIDLLRKTKDFNALTFFHTKPDLSDYELYKKAMIAPLPDVFLELSLAPGKIVKQLEEQTKIDIDIAKNLQKQTHKKEKKYRYFLEIIEQGTPRYYLRHRIQTYIEFSDEENYYDKPYPGILLICPNIHTKRFLNKFITKKLKETLFQPHLSFFTTMRENIQTEGILGKIWHEVEEK